MQRAAAALTLKKLLPRDLPRGKRTRLAIQKVRRESEYFARWTTLPRSSGR